jgi:hypothetical protein
MKPAIGFLILLAVALAACGDTVVVLRNPQTGQMAQCKGFYWHQDTPSGDTDVCVRYYQQKGFEPIEMQK